MRIACLGWGSLIWDPRELPTDGEWHPDGPWLPIEFARVSQNQRLTLVCVPGHPLVQSLWALLTTTSLDQTIEALRKREGISKENATRDIGVWLCTAESTSPFADDIGRWAETQQLDGVVWTNLPPRFEKTDGRTPTADKAVAYLAQLRGDARQRAEQYVRCTPPQVRTPYRLHIEQALGWFPTDCSKDK